MATAKSGAAVGLQVGVGPQGQLPLPWLKAPLAASASLAQAHGLLLHGPAGVGHLEMALLLAQWALCEAPPDQRQVQPCGHCASCHLVATRIHPDLLLVIPEALRVQLGWVDDEDSKLNKADAKPSRELKVEQVRQAIAWGQQTSGRGRGKVLVVHPADALNTVAANALLKTLEEPPGQLRLLLTSADPERLLPTVRSRCQKLAMRLPDEQEALAWLRAQGVAQPDSLLAVAGGSPLEALAWAHEGLTHEWLSEFPRRTARGDASPLSGRPIPRVVDLLLKVSLDAQCLAAGGQARFFPTATWPDKASAAALRVWQQQLVRAARHDEHAWNAGLLIESLVGGAKAVWA